MSAIVLLEDRPSIANLRMRGFHGDPDRRAPRQPRRSPKRPGTRLNSPPATTRPNHPPTRTVDRLTGGRLMVGVGVGWNQEQFANASSLPWKRRFTAIRKMAGALRVLWTEEEPEYHGELVDFDAVWCNPKPIQSGGPPLLFGAMGPVGPEHTAQWADGWMPLDLLERYRDMGIDRCLVGSSIENADKPDRMWRDLDELGELVSAQ